MEKEKELTNVPGLNPDDVVVIKRFSWSQKNKILSKALDISSTSKAVGRNVKENNIESKMDLYELRIRTLLYGIKSAPFFIYNAADSNDAMQQKRKIFENDNFAPETGEFLYDAIDKLNADSVINAEVEKKSEESSEVEVAQTPN